MLVISAIWEDLLAAFVVGGAFVTMATVISEKYGSTIGGLVTGLPSTFAISLLFIGLTQSATAAVAASTIIPLESGFNGILLAEYVLVSKRKPFYVSLFVSLALWFTLSALGVLAGIDNYAVSLAGGIVLVSVSYFLMRLEVKTPAAKGVSLRYSGAQLAMRAFATGFVIDFAVVISKVVGPILGGVFSIFPVIFTSTLVITNKTRGKEFTRHLVMPLMLSNAVGVMTYSAAMRYFYPEFGVLSGTLLSYLVSLVIIYVAYRLIRR